MQVVKLDNGLELPLIGLGTNTFGKVGHNWNGELNFDTKELVSALKMGYTFLDTAIVYRNEAVVGLGYKAAGVLRHHVIIQTKLPVSGAYIKDEETIREAIGESLHKLSTSYIDIVLIHQPRPRDEENLWIYSMLEKLVDEGKINALGVSNFSVAQLDYLLKHARIKPVINQIEVHPGYWNEELIEFCQKNNVLVQAWSPLFRTSEADKQTLINIGAKYHKSWAQVVIRYLVERGVMVITKSHEEMRQRENIDVFDFTLSEEDKNIIASLNIPNFKRVGVLGGTGFVGSALTKEALRIGYEVVNVSREAKIMPQRHLTIIKGDIRKTKLVLDALKDVDVIITALNSKESEEYLELHLQAINMARSLNKPLVVIGTFSNLFALDLKTKIYQHLDAEEAKTEKVKSTVLDILEANKDIDWTYISPSKVVNKNYLHHPFTTGTNVVLVDKNGESEISVIDLVDFALETSSFQALNNHLQLTIGNC